MKTYIARLTKKDSDGRLLRRLGRHQSLMHAMEFAQNKFGAKNVSSVQISKQELNK
jgi:hypothetical protein